MSQLLTMSDIALRAAPIAALLWAARRWEFGGPVVRAALAYRARQGAMVAGGIASGFVAWAVAGVALGWFPGA
jgi:hypothetical protein